MPDDRAAASGRGCPVVLPGMPCSVPRPDQNPSHVPLGARIFATVDQVHDPVLQVRGLRRTYDAETAPVRALRGVDLSLASGEFVALMGPSGCGKSTLLHIVAGLNRADEGSVRLAGEELTGLSEDRLARVRRRHVGLVFQFFELLEGMTVQENVVLAALVAGESRRTADHRTRDLLDMLGLLDKARSAPASLSGGQRQRLAIARALANRPTLLLADEPTGALDSDGAGEVLDLFRLLHAEGQSILMVTHSRDVAAGASRIVQMRDGAIALRAAV
jgi:putative ABC transport system ATP-binding protein